MPPRRKKRKLCHGLSLVPQPPPLRTTEELPLEIWEMILRFVGMHDLLCLLRYESTWKRTSHVMVIAARSICAQLINRTADHVDNVAKYYDLDENRPWRASGNISEYHLKHFNPPGPELCPRNAGILKLFEMVSMIKGMTQTDLSIFEPHDATQVQYMNITKLWLGIFMKTQGIRWSLKQDVSGTEIDRLFGETPERHEFSFFSLWMWMPCFGSRLVTGILVKVTDDISIRTLFNGQYMIKKPWSTWSTTDLDSGRGPRAMSRFLRDKMIMVMYYLYNYITRGYKNCGAMLDQKVVQNLDAEIVKRKRAEKAQRKG